MDAQNIIVAVIIIAAALYVGQILWRKIKGFSAKSSCEADCGCGKSKSKVSRV